MKTLKQQYDDKRKPTPPAPTWEPHPLLVLAGLLIVGAAMIAGTILFWVFIWTAT